MPKQYYEKIVIGKGGFVGRCDECKKTGGLRFVIETCNVCPDSPGSWQDKQTYRLCDKCADREKAIFAAAGGEVIDDRETTV